MRTKQKRSRELKQLHDTTTLTTPSSIVSDLDPAVERVILRCLEKDPEKRPASALTVAAALPGGDPLAAALAAGETPSPELLVAAGESVAVPVVPALAMLAAFFLALVLGVVAGSRGSVVSQLPMAIPRDALADRASLILKKLGQGSGVADRATGFHFDGDYLRWAQKNGPPAWWTDLRIGRPAALIFWYRTSPEALAPSSPASRVTARDPPVMLPGMQQLFLDTEGRLVEFHSVPPAIALENPASDAPWPALFEAADLDVRTFTPASPKWLPPVFADATAAWEGPMPGRADMRVRIEAASYRNHPVSFQIVWPWTEPPRTDASQRTGLQRLTDATSIAIWVAMLAGAVLLARRNLRANRSDRRGAARLAIGMTAASIAVNLLGATHVANPSIERMQIAGALAFGAFTGGMMWIYYLAIEPYARRFWPDALLGWTRLLSGHVRDPRVGRELLIGLVFGAVGLLIDLAKLVPMALGWRIPGLPFGNGLQYLDGVPLVACAMARHRHRRAVECVGHRVDLPGAAAAVEADTRGSDRGVPHPAPPLEQRLLHLRQLVRPFQQPRVHAPPHVRPPSLRVAGDRDGVVRRQHHDQCAAHDEPGRLVVGADDRVADHVDRHRMARVLGGTGRSAAVWTGAGRLNYLYHLASVDYRGEHPSQGQWKPRIRFASQSSIVVKYDGTNRWSDFISALLPTFASNMSWFAFGTTTSV